MPHPSDHTRHRLPILLFLLVASLGLLTRLILCLAIVPLWEARSNIAPAPDAYPTLAVSLARDGVLGYDASGVSPTTVRGPGFPVWLAIAVACGATSTSLLALWGSLPGVVVAAVLAALVCRRVGPIPGLLAGCIVALHPLPALTAARALSDDFAGALGALGILTWCFALRSQTTHRAFLLSTAAAVCFSWLTLTRNVGMLTLLVACAAGLLGRRPHRLILTAMLVVLSLVPPVLWSIRSSRLEGRPVLVQSLTYYNFWIGQELDKLGSGPSPSGHWQQFVDATLRRAGLESEVGTVWRYTQLTPSEAALIETRLQAQARDYILDHPIAYAGRVIRGLGRFWVQATTTKRTIEYAAAVLPLLLLAAIGTVRLLRSPKPRDALAVMFLFQLLLTSLAYAAVIPFARMSVQVYPALAYLVSLGLPTRRAAPVNSKNA